MDAPQNTPASSDLSEYGALLRRRWWVVAACALVGLMAGGALLLVQPKVYSSTVQINVDEAPGAEGGNKNKVNLDTEAAIMKSSSVAAKVQGLLKVEVSPSELQSRIEVDAVPNSSVLTVSYNAANPTSARQGATAYAQGYLANRAEQFRTSAATQIRAYREQTTSLNNELRKIAQQRRLLPANSTERPILLIKQNSVTQQIAGIGEKIALLQGQAVTPGNIISNAQPGKQTSPVSSLFLGSGLMVGLLLGVFMALWRDRADRTLRRADDVQRLLNLPVLLNVPGKGKSAMGVLPARSQGGQAFHELGHSLNATLGHGNHVVLVTSVTPGLGASVISANLAAALARTENDTVFVCANLPSAYSARLFDLNPGPGLSEALVHGAKLSTVVQTPADLPRLRVITPGLDEELAWERLQTQSMDRLIDTLRKRAAYVIIEAPPTSTSADAQALAEVADATIIVVEVPRAQRQHVSEAVRQLDRMGSAVLGSVVLPTQPGTIPAHSGSRGGGGRSQAGKYGSGARSSGSRHRSGYDSGYDSSFDSPGAAPTGQDPALPAPPAATDAADLQTQVFPAASESSTASRVARAAEATPLGIRGGGRRRLSGIESSAPGAPGAPGEPGDKLPPSYESDKFRGAAKPSDNGVGGGPDRVGEL